MGIIKRLLQGITIKGPPIFADFMIETKAGQTRIDAERPGWLADAQPLLGEALRVGLVLRWEREPRVWLRVYDRDTPQLYSKVIGYIDERGHGQARVACVQCGRRYAWLHKSGLVEVAQEPTVRFR